MKKILIFTIFGIILFFNPSYALTVKISPPTSQLTTATDTFNVSVMIEDVSNFGGFQFSLLYDPAIVTIEEQSHVVQGDFLGSTGGTVLPLSPKIDNTLVKLTVGAFIMGENSGPSGSGTLATITFTVKSQTNGNLNLENVQISDANGDALKPDSISNGEFTFTTVHLIKASAGENGAIIPSGDILVNQGNSQLFTFCPDACYHVRDVLADNISKGMLSEYLFSDVTTDHTIHVDFARTQHTLKADADAGGTIEPSGEMLADCGTDQRFQIIPDTCYHVKELITDGNSVGAKTEYTFSDITANHTIQALFEMDRYAITAEADANGIITPSGIISAACGTEQVFTISPAPDNYLTDVTVDGKSVGAVSTYTFENITESHTIRAFFASYTPPGAITGSAETISYNGAVLKGQINTSGLPTTYYFEYGTTTAYGFVTPETEIGENISVSAILTDLDDETVYHYWLVATNRFGTTYGEDLVFTTSPCASGAYAPAAECRNSTAIHMDDPVFTAWATGYTDIHYGEGANTSDDLPERALSKADGISVVSLGEGGSITMTFSQPIINGDGADFAIFENSPDDNHLELAYIEVSSDGEHFIRFDNDSLTEPPNAWGYVIVYPFNINGFAGKYCQGYGTPFDLEMLANKTEVLNGTIDINHINYIRIIDVISGKDTDASGNIIYDAYTASETRKGFDLDAIGVIHAIPIQPGDLNGSGIIELDDSILVLRIMAGISNNIFYIRADVNHDGKIGIEEALFILREISLGR